MSTNKQLQETVSKMSEVMETLQHEITALKKKNADAEEKLGEQVEKLKNENLKLQLRLNDDKMKGKVVNLKPDTTNKVHVSITKFQNADGKMVDRLTVDSVDLTDTQKELQQELDSLTEYDKKQLNKMKERAINQLVQNKLRKDRDQEDDTNGTSTKTYEENLITYLQTVNQKLPNILNECYNKSRSKELNLNVTDVVLPSEITEVTKYLLVQNMKASIHPTLRYILPQHNMNIDTNVFTVYAAIMDECSPADETTKMNNLTTMFDSSFTLQQAKDIKEFGGKLRMNQSKINQSYGYITVSDEMLKGKLIKAAEESPEAETFKATLAQIKASLTPLTFDQVLYLLQIAVPQKNPTLSANMARTRGGKGGGKSRGKGRRNQDQSSSSRGRSSFLQGSVNTKDNKSNKLCFNIINGQECPFGDNCYYSHDFKIVRNTTSTKGRGRGRGGRSRGTDRQTTNSNNNDSDEPDNKHNNEEEESEPEHASNFTRNVQQQEEEENDSDDDDEFGYYRANAAITNYRTRQHTTKHKCNFATTKCNTIDRPENPKKKKNKKRNKEKKNDDTTGNLFYSARSLLTKFIRDALTLIFTCSIITLLYTGSFALKLPSLILKMFLGCKKINPKLPPCFRRQRKFRAYMNYSVSKDKNTKRYSYYQKEKFLCNKPIFLDSGCSSINMTGDLSLFLPESLQEIQTPVELANKSKVMATKRGLIVVGGNTMEAIYIPDFNTLISKGYLISKRFSSITTAGGCETFYDHQGHPFLSFQLNPREQLFELCDLRDQTQKCYSSQ